MHRNDDPRDEDAGYGNGRLVGSDRSGLRSAREAQDAVDAARDRAAQARSPQERDTSPATEPAAPAVSSTTRASAVGTGAGLDPNEAGNGPRG